MSQLLYINIMKMNIVIVLGSGNSGAGAIHDYLVSRNDFQSLFKNQEFRIVNDPDGLDELYNTLYRNFSFNGCANKISNFKKFINYSFNSNINKKNNIYSKKIINISNEFIKKISLVEYNGCPRFFLDKISFLKKLIFYFNRFVLRKNAKKISMIHMILPCEEQQFLKYAEEFIFDIFKSNKNFNPKKNIVVEQGGNFLNPISSTKYYGKNRKIIFVSRNPKAIFWSMKRRNSLSYPGHDVKKFVKWYKNITNKINKDEFKKIIHIKFEHFFENYEAEIRKLSDRLELKLEGNNFDLNYTLKNLYKYKKGLSPEEINFIDNNINEDWKD